MKVPPLTEKQLKSVESTLSGGTWIITAGAVLFSVLTVTPLVERVTPDKWDWTAPILPIVVDAAVVIVIRLDSAVSRLGESGGGWPAFLRWLTGGMTLALNVGDSALKGDGVGVAVHCVAPGLLIFTAEAALSWRRAIHRGLDRIERERREQADRERAERDAREQRERDEREREREARERSERETREHAEREAREKADREREEREREREHALNVQREQREHEERGRREEREWQERKELREKRERDEREQAQREQADRERAERDAREQRERDTRERRAGTGVNGARNDSVNGSVNGSVNTGPTSKRNAVNAPKSDRVNAPKRPAVNAKSDRVNEDVAREAVRVGLVNGRSVRQIAEETGWSVGWVSNRMNEARDEAAQAEPAAELVTAGQAGEVA